MVWNAKAAWPAEKYALPARAELALQGLDGRALLFLIQQHLEGRDEQPLLRLGAAFSHSPSPQSHPRW